MSDSDPHWYAFRAYNSEAFFGYGTEAEADEYAERLNRGKEVNLYGAYELEPHEAADIEDRDDGFNLADELAAGEEG